MRTKLTITIDERTIEQAKNYAKDKDRSLSELVKNYLKVVLENNEKIVKLSPSIKKLKGSVKMPDDSEYKKELTNILSEKHVL